MVYSLTDLPAPNYSYENNAKEIWDALRNAGLTEESAAGILGNMEAESYCNPGQGELGQGMSEQYGLGLIQWTPPGHVGPNPIVTALGSGWYNGYRQVAYILGPDTAAFYPSRTHPEYSYSWAQFKQLTNVETATKAYFYERERGTWSDKRLTYANHYFFTFTGRQPEPTPDPPPEPIEDNTVLGLLLHIFKPKDFKAEKSTLQKIIDWGGIR